MLIFNDSFGIIFLCNKHIVTWSGTEVSSHINLCLCALFLFGGYMKDYSYFFSLLLNECDSSYQHSDVPIAAMLIDDNDNIVSIAHNTREINHNVLEHAEINAIINASKKLERWNLSDLTLLVTLKPCSMCESIIKQSRIRKVIYLLDKPDFKKEFDNTDFLLFESDLSRSYKDKLSSFFKEKR